VLGIDPGTLATGYGIVTRRGKELVVLASGTVRNSGSTPLPQRLQNIYSELREIIAEYGPTECAIESAFYGKNAQSALKLGHARGVSMLAAVEQRLSTAEYSPREVKKAVVGNGNASKEQVQFMVRSLLHLDGPRMRLDASDALAVALCHLHRCIAPSRRRTDWKSYAENHPERVRR
jgi:crossover junction endodeoxyribonuclease RuvC